MTRRTLGRSLLVTSIVVIVVILAAYIGIRSRWSASASRLGADLGDVIRRIDDQRHVRPVLRAPESDTNAAEFASPLRVSRHGGNEGWSRPPTVDLDVLRALTHGHYAQSRFPSGPSYYPFWVEGGPGQLQLLAAATHAAPAECLRMTADAVRSLQDHSYTCGVECMTELTRLYERAARIARDCPIGASREELSTASREFVTLADHGIPARALMRVQVVMEVQRFASLLLRPPLLPRSPRDVGSLMNYARTIATCESLLQGLSHWERLDSGSPPGALTAEADTLERQLNALDSWGDPPVSYRPSIAAYYAAIGHLRETAAWLDARTTQTP